MSKQPTLLIDSPNLLYRSYFAIPLNMVAKDGVTPVNAVRGYLGTLNKLMREWNAKTAIHVFDGNWRPEWRVALYPNYKAQRVEREEPQGLFAQFDVVKEIVKNLGQSVATASQFEADDVIATLAAKATPEDPALVVSGDRDFVSLIRDPAVSVLYLTPTSQTVLYDDAAALEKYGVHAAQYADYAILRGDPSDNLPGVMGFGPRTSARLLRKYDTIEGIQDHVDEFPGALANAIRGSKEYLQIARQIVPLRTDVSFDRTAGKQDIKRLAELAEHYNVSIAVPGLATS